MNCFEGTGPSFYQLNAYGGDMHRKENAIFGLYSLIDQNSG